MKLEQLRVPLIPRSSIDCFDLGIMFFGRHFVSLVRMWSWVAIPAMLLVYVGVWYRHLNLFHVLTGLYLITGVWSTLLVARTSEAVFGDPFEWGPGNARERTHLAGLMVRAVGSRLLTMLGLCLFIIPGWWIGVRSSFFPEKAFLAPLEGRAHDRRTSELINQELGQLTQRSFTIGLMGVFVAISLFATVDFFSNMLFRSPILWNQLTGDDSDYLSSTDNSFEHLSDLLYRDPLVLAVLTGVILFVYPIVRFAWFFCYIDMRVRGDFWDLELRFQKETERLRETRA